MSKEHWALDGEIQAGTTYPWLPLCGLLANNKMCIQQLQQQFCGARPGQPYCARVPMNAMGSLVGTDRKPSDRATKLRSDGSDH